MAGLTSQGINIKRLDKVVSDRLASARNLFGNDIDTSVDSVIGRAVRVTSPSDADLWELAEAVYNSFNPAHATGISLDRVVAYAGLQRYEASPSTASLVVTGDFLGSVPSGSVVKSTATSYSFITTESAFFDLLSVSGFSFEPIAVEEAEYKVTIGLDVFSYTPTAQDTYTSIAQELTDRINSSQDYTATRENAVVKVSFNDVFISRNTSSTNNITYRKISKIIPSRSSKVGEIAQPANTLDTIGTPTLGWDSVTNPVAATVGRLRESDIELRERFKNTKELNAKGTIDAVYSNLTSLQGVTDVQVYENPTSGVDVNNLPPKSFSVVVRGGNSLEIAETLWKTKPAGIEAYGNTSVSIRDSRGLPHTMSFSRPVNVDIHVNIVISPTEYGTIAADTDVKIFDALSQYFQENYSVGDDVTYSRLYTPINTISGFQVDSLEIGRSPDLLGMANIVVGFDEIADIKQQNISVTINN